MHTTQRRRRISIASWALALVLFAAGLGAMAWRTVATDAPFSPPQVRDTWLVEAQAFVTTEGRLAKITLQAPQRSAGYEILEESFESDGFSLGAISVDGRREIVWSRRAPAGEYRLRYQALIRYTSNVYRPPALSSVDWSPRASLRASQRRWLEELVDRYDNSARPSDGDSRSRISGLLKLLADELEEPSRGDVFGDFSHAKRLKVSRQLLFLAGYESREAHGVPLIEARRDARSFSWLEIKTDDGWQPFDVNAAQYQAPPGYFAWWRGETDLIRSEGVSATSLLLSVAPVDRPDAITTTADPDSLLGRLSFESLSAESQAVFRGLLLLPLGALIISFLRCVIGLQTFGTFMPVLIALAFRETGLWMGLALFTGVIAIGLLARAIFDSLRLLIVPRLSATLTLVIIIVVLCAALLDSWSFPSAMHVALFPIVILTMTIERMAILWDEIGALKSIRQGVLSLFAASLVFLVIQDPNVEYLFFVFPELLLVVLGMLIILGRYSGFRLIELYRFRSFFKRQ
jgi:hypothetical protein